MATTYEDVTPSLIENTNMIKVFSDGVFRTYRITPCDGYVLHDKSLDAIVLDPETDEPTGEVTLGFYAGTRSVRYDYDFTANPREFYAVLRTEVPENQIFNVGGNTDHEVM
jgi:hypothetical protein